ncbi:MAG TPA: glycosyltransferase family 39 protein [Blastocatellia bacterium]|nr:glycosyltransferase family 39 protein [Blastocatellia bacterium]
MSDQSISRARGIFLYFREERFPLLLIAGFFACACLLVSPLRDVPVNDDWTYAWGVENLLRTGRVAVLDWSSNYPILQTFWGGLFSLPFGFSFGALRLSTVALAVIGCAALYLTLRELDLDRHRSLAGALLLAANPVFFVLSFSFMTDVPFLSLMNLAMLCYVAGVRRERQALLWVGGLFAAGAFLSRQIGIIIPLAMLPYLLRKEGGWPGFIRRLLPPAASLLGIGLVWLWLVKSLGRTTVMAEKLQGLPFLTSLGPARYFQINLRLLFEVAFSVFPLLLAAITLRPRRWAVAIILSAMGGAGLLWWCFGEVQSPVSDGMIWSLKELADVRGLIQGELNVPGPAHRFSLAARLLMLISTAVLIAGTARLCFITRGRMSQAARVVMTLGVLQLGLINAMWFYYDRYYLVLLPSLICLCLKLTLNAGFSKVVAFGGVALLAFVSISGTWDVLRFNQACAEAFNYLRATGVPAAEIDAGYSLTGWTLYAHPENLAPGQTPAEDVPWVTSGKELPYVISNTPLPGYETLKEISWKGSLWAVSNRIYVLHKQDHPSG